MNLRAAVSAGFVTAAVLSAVPATADARTIAQPHFVNALLPMRIGEQIGFTPVVGMQRLGAVSVRAGGNTYRGEWVNSLATRFSTTQALKEIRRYGNFYATYADRKLTSAERRKFDVLLDLGRDADVLVVQAGHPACSGLTLAQARGIASGNITNWSAVGGTGAIALRDVVVRGTYEPRFGVTKKPKAAKGSADGGVSEAAQNASVAAISSWSRVRSRGGVCAVPIDGVAPANTTVHSLSYKGAYPVTFVAAKKRRHDAYSKAALRYYVNYLASPAASKVFRATGMLLTRDTPSDDQGGGNSAGGPSRDAQGRAITPIHDADGARAALEGERLEQPRGDGFMRLVFEPGGLARIIEGGPSCTSSDGGWTMVDGWRYSENGGGYIVQIRFMFDGARDATIELPNDPAGTAWYDGQQWQRSRDLPATC